MELSVASFGGFVVEKFQAILAAAAADADSRRSYPAPPSLSSKAAPDFSGNQRDGSTAKSSRPISPTGMLSGLGIAAVRSAFLVGETFLKLRTAKNLKINRWTHKAFHALSEMCSSGPLVKSRPQLCLDVACNAAKVVVVGMSLDWMSGWLWRRATEKPLGWLRSPARPRWLRRVVKWVGCQHDDNECSRPTPPNEDGNVENASARLLAPDADVAAGRRR